MINWDSYKRERDTRKFLTSLSKQRVAVVLPNHIWIIDNVSKLPEEAEIKATCLMRGWIEIHEDNLPSGELNLEHPAQSQFAEMSAIYKLNDTGWNVIHRKRLWELSIVFLTLFGLITSLIKF